MTSVVLTPNYAALYARFKDCAELEIRKIEEEADLDRVEALRGFLSCANVMAQSVTTVTQMLEFRDFLAAVTVRVAERADALSNAEWRDEGDEESS